MTDCRKCGDPICKHGVCYCNDEPCWECLRERNLRAEAELEAAFQRDVVGPLCGFKRDEDA